MNEEERYLLNKELHNYSKKELIEKFIDEFEENLGLSDLWHKTQEENKKLHSIIKEVRELTEKIIDASWDYQEKDSIAIKQLEILDKVDKE